MHRPPVADFSRSDGISANSGKQGEMDPELAREQAREADAAARARKVDKMVAKRPGPGPLVAPPKPSGGPPDARPVAGKWFSLSARVTLRSLCGAVAGWLAGIALGALGSLAGWQVILLCAVLAFVGALVLALFRLWPRAFGLVQALGLLLPGVALSVAIIVAGLTGIATALGGMGLRLLIEPQFYAGAGLILIIGALAVWPLYSFRIRKAGGPG